MTIDHAVGADDGPHEGMTPLGPVEALAFDQAHPVSYTHLRAHETVLDLVCRLLLEKKKNITYYILIYLI